MSINQTNKLEKTMFIKTKNMFKLKGFMLGLSALLAGGLISGLAVSVRAQEGGQAGSEREQFIKEIRRVENLNKKYTQEISDVKQTMTQQQEDFNKRVNQLEEKLNKNAEAPKAKPADPAQAISAQMEEKTYDILSHGAEMDPNDEAFKDELAKAHYNMGNIFFQRGEYQRAVVEYYQAVDLSPYDADIHFNLAFISGEYLKDQETSLKHYQWYLYLRPDADDIDLVKEKMAAAKLSIRARIDSPLDKDKGYENVIR